jgi:hypothetical protein
MISEQGVTSEKEASETSVGHAESTVSAANTGVDMAKNEAKNVMNE